MAASIHYRRLRGYKYATNQDAEFCLRWGARDNWTGSELEARAPGAPVGIKGWLELRSDAALTIKAGYAWDGPSGPAAWPGVLAGLMGLGIGLQGLVSLGFAVVALGALWVWVAYLTRDSRDFMRASLVHDALYQLFRAGLLEAEAGRLLADRIMRQHCIEDGMGALRGGAIYLGVRAFGKKNARPQPKLEGERELVAP